MDPSNFLQKSKFLKPINIKQRQFNFTQPNPEPQTESSLVVYVPRKIIKTNELQMTPVQLTQSPLKSVLTSFLSQLTQFKDTMPEFKKSQGALQRLNDKIKSKQKQSMYRACRMTNEHTDSIPQSIAFEFKLEDMKQSGELSDDLVISLSQSLQMNKSNLTLDLFKKWHTDTSNLSDSAVENLSKSIHNMPKLTELTLCLEGWGYWNSNITNMALNHMTNAISALNNLNVLKLDLNMWGYENEKITDEGTGRLLEGISQLKELGKLEINMKGWGDSNSNITDQSVIHLSKCLSKLGNLAEVKLVLWDRISRQAIKKLNKSLSELENLTKIDLQFENSSSTVVVQENREIIQLNQIKNSALLKRERLFQVEAINNIYSEIFRGEIKQDIAIKLG